MVIEYAESILLVHYHHHVTLHSIRLLNILKNAQKKDKEKKNLEFIHKKKNSIYHKSSTIVNAKTKKKKSQ